MGQMTGGMGAVDAGGVGGAADSGMDMSSLMGMLGGMGQKKQQYQTPAPAGQGMDPTKMAILAQMMQNMKQSPQVGSPVTQPGTLYNGG